LPHEPPDPTRGLRVVLAILALAVAAILFMVGQLRGDVPVTAPCLVRPGVTAILGKSRTGKTTLALKELHGYAHRALIFDPRASEALDAVPTLTSRAEVRRHFANSAGRWIRTVRTFDLGLYSWLAASVAHWRGVVWVMDDAHSLFSDPLIAEKAIEVGVGGRHMGGRLGVELWVITHRPVMVPAAIRSQVNTIHTFRQTGPLDLAELARWCGEDFAERASQLGDYQHITGDV